MRKIVIRVAVGILLLLIALTPLTSVMGRPTQLPPACEEFAFSTEEDFVSGESVISDGDLLTVYEDASGAVQCAICARNADLLAIFQVPHDLGLDAADVIDAERTLVAFSTELNSSNPGQFTQGDLLVTNGVIILNRALTARWAGGQGVGYDLGLDAVHFLGDPEQPDAILNFVDQAAGEEQPIGPAVLGRLLESNPTVDIWFSTSGTWSVAGAPGFLDGDLLSARSGSIVASNADLLPPGVPAGLPSRGVDFGLDAVTADRAGTKEQIHHSTELLFDGEPAFTDGDVLLFGNGVVITHQKLIECFGPPARFLGLDALHMALEPPSGGEIQGTKFHDENANGAFDPGEPGLERWVIHLDGSGVSEQTTTNASGVYSFTVPAGSYTVTEECPDGWYQSVPSPLQGVCGSGIHNIELLAGQSLTDVDFGNYRTITFEGAKFYDRNQNETWDPEEPPLGQWAIHLDGLNGMSQDVNLEEWTTASGHYTFTVPPGSYFVREVCQPGWGQTVPPPGSGCGSGVYPFDPISGQLPETGKNFGNYETVDIYLPVILKDYP
jgi:hypothetical protein